MNTETQRRTAGIEAQERRTTTAEERDRRTRPATDERVEQAAPTVAFARSMLGRTRRRGAVRVLTAVLLAVAGYAAPAAAQCRDLLHHTPAYMAEADCSGALPRRCETAAPHAAWPHYVTASSEVLDLFDRGLQHYFAGDRGTAVTAFESAVRLDAGCAMCYWGLALAYGPDLNVPMDSMRFVFARRASRQALEAAIATMRPVERDLIGALYARYSPAPTGGGAAARDSAYANRMVQLARRYATPDIRTLAAEALLLLDPDRWMTTRRESTRSEIQAVALLEAALADRPDHAGALRLHTALVRSQADWATIVAGGSR